ncbi:MarR family winged helix-turn-helix transcriptional regulator [Hoeflea sp. TYP-13]|uniref:MarR family winged helix-turn-helix transcriptional regulator n=1 Tax=Hoeflea sp. TYP-13 TaxID=3230023 RepID=UPI0034C6C0A8
MTKEKNSMEKDGKGKPESQLPEHIGWDLWRARDRWKTRFVDAMQQRGHGWFTEARANLLGLMPRKGMRQADLVARSGLSKQAIQQFVDALVSEGILQRKRDPDDARGKIVGLTEKGMQAMHDADEVKRTVEEEIAARFSPEEYAVFSRVLRQIAEN